MNNKFDRSKADRHRAKKTTDIRFLAAAVLGQKESGMYMSLAERSGGGAGKALFTVYLGR